MSRDHEQEKLALGRLLERLFKSARTVDTESLCILPGEQVWSLRLDVHVLNHDGNAADAVSLAALAALLDFRRPDSTVIDGKAVIVSIYLFCKVLSDVVLYVRETPSATDDPAPAGLRHLWHLRPL